MSARPNTVSRPVTCLCMLYAIAEAAAAAGYSPKAAARQGERLLRDPAVFTVLDVGGDYIGARSIGGYAPLLNRPETAVYYVVNPYRPWSGTLERLDQVLTDILAVSHLRFENLLLAANPNLGEGTTAEDVLDGVRQLETLLEGRWPIRFVGVEESLLPLSERLPYPVFPIRRYLTYPW